MALGEQAHGEVVAVIVAGITTTWPIEDHQTTPPPVHRVVTMLQPPNHQLQQPVTRRKRISRKT
jgi:hypothetical protein